MSVDGEISNPILETSFHWSILLSFNDVILKKNIYIFFKSVKKKKKKKISRIMVDFHMKNKNEERILRFRMEGFPGHVKKQFLK